MPSRPNPRARLARLPQPRHWITVPLVLTVAAFALGFCVKLIPGLTSPQFDIDVLLNRNHNPIGDAIALTIDAVLSPPGIVVILLVLFVLLLVLRRSPASAIALCTAITVSWLSSAAVKLIVDQPRPDTQLLQHPLVAAESSGSFPSGHTTFAVALAIGLYFLARDTRWAGGTIAAGILFTVLVAVSRLYLGVHYPSDVVGSFLVAAAAMLLYSGLWNRYGLRVLRRIGVKPTSPWTPSSP